MTDFSKAREMTALGVRIRVLSSCGAHTVLDYTAPPGFDGVRPHYHAVSTEWFRVLDGRMAFEFPDGVRLAGAGDFVEVAPRRVHKWRNADPDRALEFLFGFDRAGMEGYFQNLLTLATEAPTWPPSDPSVLARLGAAYDTFSA
jgi:mannose-6-phosphate isomerase-like protein (cupin superfamily)